MKNKILSNLSYIFCVGLGLFHFIFLAIPYVARFVSGSYDYTYHINGYGIITDLWNGGFGGVTSGIFQILILVFVNAMIAFGIYAFFKGFENNKIGEYALFGYAGLNVLLLVFLIVCCATNTSEYGYYSMSVGIRFSAGIFITLAFAIGSIVALKVLEKRFPVSNEIMPQVNYECTKCGRKVKKGVKFCPDCGGAVEEKEQFPTRYACVACGREVAEEVKFCPECGGAIEEKVQFPARYACVACGKEVKKEVKFCPECGGAIKEKVQFPTRYACVSCGKTVKKEVKFCPDCGGVIKEKTIKEASESQSVS